MQAAGLRRRLGRPAPRARPGQRNLHRAPPAAARAEPGAGRRAAAGGRAGGASNPPPSRSKEVNPHGLAFIAGQAATFRPAARPRAAPGRESRSPNCGPPWPPPAPAPPDVLRVTCFLSSLEGLAAVRADVRARIPVAAAATSCRSQRAPARAVAECEAVARLAAAPASPVEVPSIPRPSTSPPATRRWSWWARRSSSSAARRWPSVSRRTTRASPSSAWTRPWSRPAAIAQEHGLRRLLTRFPSLAPLIRKVRAEFFDPARPARRHHAAVRGPAFDGRRLRAWT